MLLQLAEREAGGPRVVVETAHWLAIVPWWAEWPFETLLIPRCFVHACRSLTSRNARISRASSGFDHSVR